MPPLPTLEARLPFGAAELTTVTFATANADTLVPHDFPPGRYREVLYLPLAKSVACDIYAGTRAPDRAGLFLRSTVAPATVTLLLLLPREASHA